MADASGINRTYVSKLETAGTYVGLEIIGKLAEVLGVEAYELLIRPAKRIKQRREPNS